MVLRPAISVGGIGYQCQKKPVPKEVVPNSGDQHVNVNLEPKFQQAFPRGGYIETKRGGSLLFILISVGVGLFACRF